jgi:hypothetical protein
MEERVIFEGAVYSLRRGISSRAHVERPQPL